MALLNPRKLIWSSERPLELDEFTSTFWCGSQLESSQVRKKIYSRLFNNWHCSRNLLAWKTNKKNMTLVKRNLERQGVWDCLTIPNWQTGRKYEMHAPPSVILSCYFVLQLRLLQQEPPCPRGLPATQPFWASSCTQQATPLTSAL